MAEKRMVANLTLKYKEVFDPWDLYLMMREWAIEEGWVVRKDSKFQEVFYLQKETTAGTEIWYWWRFQKEINTFYRYDLMVDAHILFLKPHELIVEGKKVKTYSAEVEFTIRSLVVLDQNDSWEKHWLLKHLLDYPFKQRIFKKDIDYHIFTLARNTQRLQEMIKSYFQIQSFERDREQRFFFPKQSGTILGEPNR